MMILFIINNFTVLDGRNNNSLQKNGEYNIKMELLNKVIVRTGKD